MKLQKTIFPKKKTKILFYAFIIILIFCKKKNVHIVETYIDSIQYKPYIKKAKINNLSEFEEIYSHNDE